MKKVALRINILDITFGMLSTFCELDKLGDWKMPDVTKPILGVGSSNMDLVAKTPKIPVTGETLSGADFSCFPAVKVRTRQ